MYSIYKEKVLSQIHKRRKEMDRNDLIKALGNAFESPKEEPATPSSHVESANVGEKDVLRLLTDYQSKGAMYATRCIYG